MVLLTYGNNLTLAFLQHKSPYRGVNCLYFIMWLMLLVLIALILNPKYIKKMRAAI